MKDHPILFSAPMVRALLDGTKTQTRRVVKRLEVRDGMPEPEWESLLKCCPYGQTGEQLWVRESVAYDAEWGHFWADGKYLCEVFGDTYSEDDALPNRGVPSIHVPRRYSRITLKITGVRVERLQDISEADAQAEGVYTDPACPAYDGYRDLWESINGTDSWDLNPWVWCVSFKVVKP
jgi:hypothetical protein